MSTISTQTQHPTVSQLAKATLAAVAAAGLILITTVLPAEYGIDPTGVGGRLGLGVLAANHDTETSSPAPAVRPAQSAGQAPSAASSPADHFQIASKAAEAFGANAGQSFDTAAVSLREAPYRNDTLSLTLEPGKGAEVKALLKAGDGIVFHWAGRATSPWTCTVSAPMPRALGPAMPSNVRNAKRPAPSPHRSTAAMAGIGRTVAPSR